MKIGLHANMVDRSTSQIADVLRDVFEKLCDRLNGDYGGIIEHLWIDFELIEIFAKPNGKPRFPFRFQKRVSGRSSFGLGSSPDYYNVGHFSVRPNFAHLLSITENDLIEYCLNLIYKELNVLLGKEKKLGGFQSQSFIDKFHDECNFLGYNVNSNQ